MRTGGLPYVIVSALVLLLIGVTGLVLTNNQISEKEDQAATLKREDAEERARAERLAAYTQFLNLQEQRVATVTSLADSRFDWERVMRELSLVLPQDVWLVEMTASASPEAGISGGGASGLRSSSPGPALELSGCATGQDAVAGFVTALKDIDGVTRVGVRLSELAGSDSESGSSSGGGGGSENDCQTRQFIAKFEVVLVFDAAPVPLSATGEAEAAAATEVAATTSEESSTESTEGSEG